MSRKRKSTVVNPIAKSLSDGRFRKRVVASKKVYNRKAASSKARPYDFRCYAPLTIRVNKNGVPKDAMISRSK